MRGGWCFLHERRSRPCHAIYAPCPWSLSASTICLYPATLTVCLSLSLSFVHADGHENEAICRDFSLLSDLRGNTHRSEQHQRWMI